MKILTTLLPTTSRVVTIAVLVFGTIGTANAEVYDFKFLSGGGGGVKPESQRIARGMGVHICLDVSAIPVLPANGVRFFLWSQIPQPASRVGKVVFDTGKHPDLFTKISVTLVSPGKRAKLIGPMSHAFLPTLTPSYWIEIDGGLAPGNMISISATLGNGKTFDDVIRALNEGINPTTASFGLRVGVIAYSLLGGPPPGVATINDDGGFVTNSLALQCRGR